MEGMLRHGCDKDNSAQVNLTMRAIEDHIGIYHIRFQISG